MLQCPSAVVVALRSPLLLLQLHLAWEAEVVYSLWLAALAGRGLHRAVEAGDHLALLASFESVEAVRRALERARQLVLAPQACTGVV